MRKHFKVQLIFTKSKGLGTDIPVRCKLIWSLLYFLLLCDQHFNLIENQYFTYLVKYFSIELKFYRRFEMQFRGIFCLICPVGFLCYCFVTSSLCEAVLSEVVAVTPVVLCLNSGIFFYFFVTAQLKKDQEIGYSSHLNCIFTDQTNTFLDSQVSFVKQVVPI